MCKHVIIKVGEVLFSFLPRVFEIASQKTKDESSEFREFKWLYM